MMTATYQHVSPIQLDGTMSLFPQYFACSLISSTNSVDVHEVSVQTDSPNKLPDTGRLANQDTTEDFRGDLGDFLCISCQVFIARNTR
jgi:hypothetical protein